MGGIAGPRGPQVELVKVAPHGDEDERRDCAAVRSGGGSDALGVGRRRTDPNEFCFRV